MDTNTQIKYDIIIPGTKLIHPLSIFICHFNSTVPQTSVSMIQSPSGHHYTGRSLTLSCFTFLDDEAVDLPIRVVHNWSGSNGVVRSYGRISASDVFGSLGEFQSSLVFTSLLSSDSGVYTCSSMVRPQVSSIYISPSTTTRISAVLMLVRWGKVVQCLSFLVTSKVVR